MYYKTKCSFSRGVLNVRRVFNISYTYFLDWLSFFLNQYQWQNDCKDTNETSLDTDEAMEKRELRDSNFNFHNLSLKK